MLDKEIEKIKKALQKEMPAKVSKIKGELYASYRNIASNTIKETFVSYYGNSIDLLSLENSVSYTSINDFRPDFFYNKNFLEFKILPNNKFKNRDKDYWARNLWDIYDSSESVSEFDDYYNEDDEDEEWNDIVTGFYQENVYREVNGKSMLFDKISVDEVYGIAKTRVMQEFKKEYEIHLKPQILKKYGISIG